MGSMSIGEVAQWAGVRPSTLRYYEGVGLLPPPERTNGRRRVLAREKLTEVEALVERAQGMKRLLERGLRCECLRLEDCELLGR
jgi:DNA-binding transcriptional MerR regulator